MLPTSAHLGEISQVWIGEEKKKLQTTCVGRGHGDDEAAGSTRLVELLFQPAACDVNHQDESELGAVGCELRRDLQTQSVSLLKDSDSRSKHNDLFNVEGWNCYSTLKVDFWNCFALNTQVKLHQDKWRSLLFFLSQQRSE